jgi:DNA polymerase elongation subunit (family B)
MKFYTNVHQIGDHILVRGYENGQKFDDRVEYHPTIFIPSREKSKYKTIDGKPLAPIKPGTIKETRDFIRKYDGVENFQIHGMNAYRYSWIYDNFPKDKGIDYDFSLLTIATIDIEVGSSHGFPDPTSAIEEVQAITIGTGGKYSVFGCGEFNSNDENVEYFQCSDENHLIQEFISFWERLSPDIITGWNIQGFDIPYLYNRIVRLYSVKEARRLSPWNRIHERVTNFRGKEVIFHDLIGIAVIDYIDVYRRNAPPAESYRLDYIASIELGERKLSFEEYGNLFTLYKENFQKFIEYNIKDVQLVERLEEKKKLIEMVVALAYEAKVNYQDTFGMVMMWEVILANDLMNRNIVVPPKKDNTKNKAYTGAYVKEVQTGMHKWVVSFDLNSLYPHLIMQYNVSPETILTGVTQQCGVENLLEKRIDLSKFYDKDITIAASGQAFRKDEQGFLPRIMQEKYNNRVIFKKKEIAAKKKIEKETDPVVIEKLKREADSFGNKQTAMKLMLNSVYGAFGNPYFRFYDLRISEAITLGGQLSIRWAEIAVNKYLNKILETEEVDYVLASDTDSLYITLDALVQKVFPEDPESSKVIDFLDKVCETKLQGIIDSGYTDLANYMNAYDQKMFMKREILADKGIWTGKKHYILNVHDNEGVRYTNPRIKVMGIESVKSSTPTSCRDKLKKSFDIIINQDEEAIQKFILDFRVQFEKEPIENIAFPRSVRGIEKYNGGVDLYAKGTPVHVKATRLYNHFLKQKKLQNKYPLIQEGEKIKFVYLKQPNPIRDGVIAMMEGLPEEFGLHDYIDYEKQFEKSFGGPLNEILKVIGWSSEKRSTLEAFFI